MFKMKIEKFIINNKHVGWLFNGNLFSNLKRARKYAKLNGINITSMREYKLNEEA